MEPEDQSTQVDPQGVGPPRAEDETLRSVCEDVASWIRQPPSSLPPRDEDGWRRVREVAQVHGVTQLLERSLKAASYPTPLDEWLEQQSSMNALRVGRLFDELTEILGLAETRGVDVMALKGPIVVELYGRKRKERPMNDLDLLVREGHGDSLHGVLEDLGYRRVFEGWKHSKYLKPGNESVVDERCEHPDNPRPVEVHPLCRERIGEDVIDLTDEMWSSASRGELLSTPAWLPSVEALWRHLLIHTTHHVLLNTFRLSQLLDLEHVRRRLPRLDEPTSIDPRATIPALVLLDRYFPREAVSALIERLLARVEPGYASWSRSLDLYSASYLDPTPWRG